MKCALAPLCALRHGHFGPCRTISQLDEPAREKGNPDCPVCKGDGYFFGQKTPRSRAIRYYCDCEANIREREERK